MAKNNWVTDTAKEPAGFTHKFVFQNHPDGNLQVFQTISFGSGNVSVATTFDHSGTRATYTQTMSSPKGMDDLLNAAKQQWKIIQREMANVRTALLSYAKFKANEPPSQELTDAILSAGFDNYARDFNVIRTHNTGLYIGSVVKMRDWLHMARKIIPNAYENAYDERLRRGKKIKLDPVEERLVDLERAMYKLTDAIDYTVESLEDNSEKQKHLSDKAEAFYDKASAVLEGLNIGWYIAANDVKPWENWNYNFSHNENGHEKRFAEMKEALEAYMAELAKSVEKKLYDKIFNMAFKSDDEPSVMTLVRDLTQDMMNKKGLGIHVSRGLHSKKLGLE